MKCFIFLIKNKALRGENVDIASPLYSYRDEDSFLSLEDIINEFQISKDAGADGAVIWGSSKSVSTTERCINLQV